MKTILEKAHERQSSLVNTPIDAILDVLHSVGCAWTPDSNFYRRAMEQLPSELSFSSKMIESTLGVLPELLDRENLRQRLLAEFGDLSILDSFVRRPHFQGKVRAFPLGTLLHITAGNVFLGAIDSLLMGLLTKNISIIKLARRNQLFPSLFQESVQTVDTERILNGTFFFTHWSHDDKATETLFKNHVDAIIAWGGEEMMKSYRDNLPLGTKLMDYGPKISFQVVFQHACDETTGKKVANDIAIYDQAACASPQVLFFEEGLHVQRLMKDIGEALDAYPIPRGELSPDEHAEILKDRQRGLAHQILDEGSILEGKTWCLVHEKAKGLRNSSLNRTLILKPFSSLHDLVAQIEPYSRYLQSCSYEGQTPHFFERLAMAGVKRFSELGTIMHGQTGSPHDGRYGLTELVSMIPIEDHADIITPERFTDGYIFSSGGTSGAPKYAHYSLADFDWAANMLAKNFRLQGIHPGDHCANLFVAGNLWSSFVAVTKALEQCRAIQLPIGGLCEKKLILDYMQRFRPKHVLGLPSLLCDIALSDERRLIVDSVFYAGEHLNQGQEALLRERWGVRFFRSAGYASVDAGPIGYQCQHCQKGEHHLYRDLVHMEIIDEEAVVTALTRKAMPAIRIHTGDRVAWIETPCACGARDPRFLLMGRLDSQMNIWGCRVHFTEIEAALREAKIPTHAMQITLMTSGASEKMRIQVEALPVDADFHSLIHRHSLDIVKTLSLDMLRERLHVDFVAEKSIPRIQRTGKIKRIVDQRE